MENTELRRILKEGFMNTKILILSSPLRRVAIVSVVLGIILTTAVAGAESQCFLKIQGIKGNATEKFHKGWIKVYNYSHRISGLPAPSVLARKPPARTYARAKAGEFVLTKAIDPASQALSRRCTNGIKIPQIKIEQRWVRGNKDVYMVYVFSNVMIVEVKPSESGSGDVPLEDVSFNYGKIEWEYTETDHSTGKPKGNVETEWDLKTSEK
jgi:type VI secretion system secreted protein Hcp